MSTCSVCGCVIGMPGNRYVCPNCYPKFEQDISEQHFPPGLTERAKRDFSYEQWTRVKTIEKRLRSGYFSMEEAVAEMKKLVQYLNDAPRLRAEAARKREELQKLRLY